jgi:hypothetical protein
LHAKRSPDEYRSDRNHLARSPSTTIQSANANDGIHIAQMQKLWGEFGRGSGLCTAPLFAAWIQSMSARNQQ